MKTSISTPLHLYLIRHGETEWSLDRRHTGRTDIPLTANGESEARELGKHLRDIQFSLMLTSPLKRAQQTCALVGLKQVPEIEPDLVEWDYGDYEGRKSVDIRKERPDWNVFRDGCPHGEMPTQICDSEALLQAVRADRLIARLRDLDGNIALFSHGQFGGVLAARWIGLTVVEAQHFPLGTASISIFAFDPHHPTVSRSQTFSQRAIAKKFISTITCYMQLNILRILIIFKTSSRSEIMKVLYIILLK